MALIRPADRGWSGLSAGRWESGVASVGAAARPLRWCKRTVGVLPGADGDGEIRRIHIILAGDSHQRKHCSAI
jgi:hypothetical protein